MSTHRSTRTTVGGLIVTGFLLLGVACSSTPTRTTSGAEGPGGSAPEASSGGSDVAADGPCVTDPRAVVTRQPSPTSTTAALPADLVAKLDAAALDSFAQAAAPGAVVGVRTPEGTFIAAYGDADPDADPTVAMAPGVHTRIGSVTKTFTGTLVLQLAEQGRLSLDDPISTYVPGIPNGDTVTLRHLAAMTSGVASYTLSTAFTDAFFAQPDTVFEADQLVAIGVAESPLFAPGERFDYSNTNTVLLGKVVEQVTGRPLGEAYASAIFEPLGLDGTRWPGTSPDLPEPYAQGYTLQGDTATPDSPTNATHWNPSWGDAAGALISTMDDLLVYDRALGTGQGLLGVDAQVQRLESFPSPAGYGLALGCVDGWVGHTGELPGYNTSVFYDTTTDTSVVVQVNSDIASGDCPESPTLTDDPRDQVCSAPATRIFVALAAALGHPFTPNPQR